MEALPVVNQHVVFLKIIASTSKGECHGQGQEKFNELGGILKKEKFCF